jgi:subtilase family serine protease
MKNFTLSYKLSFLLLIISLLALHPALLRAQSYQLPIEGMATYTTCAGTLYDDGGPTRPHDTNASGGVTLRPGTPGAKLKLEFTLLDIDSVSTYVQVYDGPDTKAPIIGWFNRGQPTVYATGTTGALTVVLTSYGLPLRGFAATISCVTSPPPSADLAVQNIQVYPKVAPAGDFINIGARIANLTGGLTAYRVRYLLSTDRTLNADDTELAQANNSVAAGTWVPEGQRLQLPSSVAPGNYYVLCVAELVGDSEVNTANNLAYAPLFIPAPTPIPDLAVTSAQFNVPRLLGAGTSLFVVTRVQNWGSTFAQSSEIGYYFSADSTFSANDQLLATTVAQTPTAGKSSYVYGSVAIPQTATPGTYYLLCVADHRDQVIEADEQNNVYAVPLQVSSPSVDVSFSKLRNVATNKPGAGGSITATCYLQNEGSARADSATVGYYLSADQLLSADDVLLGHASAGPLLPGDDLAGYLSRILTIPSGTPLGKRYLLLVADYRQELPEADETNNVAALTLDVVVANTDLAITTPKNGSIYSPAVGTAFYTRCTLANQGTTPVYPVTVGYYFSTDNQLSADDVLLGQSQLRPQEGGDIQLVDDKITLPSNAALGTAYILFVADYLDKVAETDETNNMAALAIQVSRPNIDLVLGYSSNVLAPQAAAGTEFKLGCYFNNLGTTPAYAPTVGFYLSTDPVLSSDDLLIGIDQLSWNSVYPSSYANLTGSAVIPRNTVPGRYYVLGVADYLNEFAESDRTNNVCYAALEVTPATCDLKVVENVYLSPKKALAGSQVTTESYVYNVGNALASPCKVGYFLSADPYFSPSDILLGSTDAEAVRAGYSNIVAGSFVVPAATPTGRYYILFIADYLHQTNDSDQSNNVRYTTLTVTGQVLATREQTAGYELSVLPVPVAGPTPLQVQLSSRSTRGNATVALYTTMGQVVATHGLALVPNRTNQTTFQTTGLATGVYILRITGPDLNVTRRVVIE